MKLEVNTFQGEAPRIAPELLPDNAAQVAENCRLLSGNLEAWQDLLEQPGVIKTGNIVTAYLMAGEYWLHWKEAELDYDIGAVDVARGPIEGDTNEFTIFTGAHVPRWTNIELATTEPPPAGVSVGAYPYISYRLGVPAPLSAPTLSVEQTEDDSDVELDNPGAEAGGGSITGWTVETGDLNTHDDNDVAGLEAQSGGFYFYGGAAAAVTEAYQTVVLADAGLSTGRTITLSWYQATGSNGSTGYMALEFYDASDALIVTEAGADEAPSPALTWEQRSISRLIPSDTEYFRVVMHFTRVGSGENDCYIDTIAITSSDATFSFDGSDALSGWTNSGWTIETATNRGRPQPSYYSGTRSSGVNYMYRLIGSANSPRVEFSVDIYRQEQENGARMCFVPFASSSGQGGGISIDRESNQSVQARNWSSWTTAGGSVISTLYAGGQEIFDEKWIRLHVVAERTGSSARLVVNVYGLDNGVQYLTDGIVEIPVDGDYFGIRWEPRDSANKAWFDNLAISVAAPDVTDDDDEDVVLTNYVYTFVNSIGQEGPPSPVSRDIQFTENTSVTITTPTTADNDFNVTDKRIYRAVTGTDGTTVYRLVTEIDLSTATYVDDVQDDGLEDDILITTDWDLPPIDGQNVVSLPNGITLMTAKNVVCPSVVNYPHAYPEVYRLLTESDIVAVGAIDTSVVLATQTRPYMLLGSNPESMSMSKFEQAQGCVSKRSLASIRGYGIMYASPDGLVGITGPGSLQLLTESYFSRREWQQQVVPSSIIAVAHDDRYFGSCNGQDSTGRSFIFDPRQGGNGWTWLDFTWQGAYSDPETDTLYFIVNNELMQWEGNDSSRRPYTWRSKLHQFSRPVAFQLCQVEADNYDNILLKLYSKGVLVQTRSITSDREFVVKAKATREFEYELSGTDRVRSITFVENVEEM